MTHLSDEDMMAALYVVNVDNLAHLDDDNITPYEWIERELEEGEQNDELILRYELGKAILSDYMFIATERLPLTDINTDGDPQLIGSIPANCLGYVSLSHGTLNAEPPSLRIFFFFSRLDRGSDLRRTLLNQLLLTMDENGDMFVLPRSDGDITVQRIDEIHFCLINPKNACGLSSFVGYSFEVWAAMWELETRLNSHFLLPPTLELNSEE